jgi:hypothetical protein
MSGSWRTPDEAAGQVPGRLRFQGDRRPAPPRGRRLDVARVGRRSLGRERRTGMRIGRRNPTARSSGHPIGMAPAAELTVDRTVALTRTFGPRPLVSPSRPEAPWAPASAPEDSPSSRPGASGLDRRRCHRGANSLTTAPDSPERVTRVVLRTLGAGIPSRSGPGPSRSSA